MKKSGTTHKDSRPRRGGRGWDVGMGPLWMSSPPETERPSSFHRQRRGRPQGAPPIPSPPPPPRGRGAFSPKNLYLKAPPISPRGRDKSGPYACLYSVPLGIKTYDYFLRSRRWLERYCW